MSFCGHKITVGQYMKCHKNLAYTGKIGNNCKSYRYTAMLVNLKNFEKACKGI